MFFFDAEGNPKHTFSIPSGLSARFLENIRGTELQYTVDEQAGETLITFNDPDFDEDDLILAAAKTDLALLRGLVGETSAELAADGDNPSIRNAWVVHLLGGGETITYESFEERTFRERLKSLAGFEVVPGLEVPNGVWLHVTSGFADIVAGRLSRTGVWVHIDDRFNAHRNASR